MSRVVLQARPDGHRTTGKTAEDGRLQGLFSCGKNDRGSGITNRMESGSKRLGAVSNVKLRDVTITVLPESGSKEVDEGLNPFEPSKGLLRSPTIGTKEETCDGGDSEASFSVPKEARKRLRRAIVRSEEERWKEFCATLEQDPWRRPYRVVWSKMTRGGPPESLSRGRVARILDDLFVPDQERQLEKGHCAKQIKYTKLIYFNKYAIFQTNSSTFPTQQQSYCVYVFSIFKLNYLLIYPLISLF